MTVQSSIVIRKVLSTPVGTNNLVWYHCKTCMTTLALQNIYCHGLYPIAQIPPLNHRSKSTMLYTVVKLDEALYRFASPVVFSVFSGFCHSHVNVYREYVVLSRKPIVYFYILLTSLSTGLIFGDWLAKWESYLSVQI